MGFSSAVEQIASSTPQVRQTLLFSATIDGKILPYSKKLQNHPHKIALGHDLASQGNIEQRLYYVDGIGHKIKLLERILETTEIHQAIIFTSTIRQADNLATHLHEKGFLSQALHGDMNQRQRTRTIDKFKGGHFRFLIATDVAGRGIDVASLSHVFNFDLPFQPEDFVHRVGRTGRAGAKGIAITFATYAEGSKISQINKVIPKSIEVHTIEGLEPKPKENRKPANPSKRPHNRFAKFGASRKPAMNPHKRNDKKRPAFTTHKTERPPRPI
jgi:superfamily II DNA/RNA helicase